MSDTPRTDAIALRSLDKLAYMEMINDLANLGRQLERELAEYKRMLDEALDAILELDAKTKTRNALLPDCMMPDGAEPCLGYRQLDDQLMRWFKAASPYATPGSLQSALVRFHIWQDRLNEVLKPKADSEQSGDGDE